MSYDLRKRTKKVCYRSVVSFRLPGPVKRSRKDDKLYPVEVVEFDLENQR